MKRYIFTFNILMIYLFLIACNNKDISNEPLKTGILKLDSTEASDVNIKDVQDDKYNQKGENVGLDLEDKQEVYIKIVSPFIPEGWHIVSAYGEELVAGDLNGDGISDIAFAVEGIETDGEAAPRILMIIIGNEDGTYKLAIKAENAIRKVDEGGVMGEPFMGLNIDRGSLIINHYGGSAWRWDNSYRFRFQKDGWYLIGATEDWFHAVSTMGRVYEDINSTFPPVKVG